MKRIILILLMLSIFSCEKTNNSLEDIDTTSMELELSCFSVKLNEYDSNSEFIINDADTYSQLYLLKSDSEDCNASKLPDMNFDENTLLGKCTIVSGCGEVNYNRTVVKQETLKKYIYTIEIDTSGLGHCTESSMNWILIPKIPANYSVEFNIINK